VDLARRVRRHWLFGLVLVAALALRVLVSLAFRPIMWFGGDSASYLATGLRLIPDPARVGGYGFFLWALRPLHSFAVVAALQHLMGLAMGVLIYLLARRYGLPAWGATLAAVPVLFDAYELQLEGDAVPGAPFGLLVVIALYLLLRTPGERRPARTAAAAFLLGVSALLWPVGLALLAVLLAALLAGALPVAAYAGWFSVHQHKFSLTRSDGVYLWSRTMSFADCAVIRPPAGERVLCPPPGPRMAASLYIWNGNSPLLTMPGGRFSARTNTLALHFALRAIAAQPAGYAAAVGHDFALSFYWDRPVHPDAAIVHRYQFADAATAWVPATLWTPGGGTLAGDQAAYNHGRPAPTRAVPPYASWLVSYQRFAYLPGTLLGVILLAGLAAMAARRRFREPGLPWAFAVTILLVPPLIADFDLRYVVPAVPAACLAAALALAPGRPGPGGRAPDERTQRRWTTSPAATATSAPDDTRTSSLPSGSTPTAGPESVLPPGSSARMVRPIVADRPVYAARSPLCSGSPRAFCQAWYQRSTAARMASSSGSRSRAVAPAARSEVAGSAPGPGPGSSAGPADTLRPTPTTTASPADSARMPHSLASPARTSFGHFRSAGTPVTAVTASATARPASSGSQPRRTGGGVGLSSMEKVSAARGGATQVRPIRPRPAVCSSAARTTPSGSPARARVSRSALVEPVRPTTSTARHRESGRTARRCSDAASRGARAGVWFSARMTTHYCSGS
jgi:hypothetical protein